MSRIRFDVPLVPQAETRTCWYASAQMLLAWRDRQLSRSLPPGAPILDTAFDEGVNKANERIHLHSFINFASALGLRLTNGPLNPDNLVVRLAYCGPMLYTGRVNGWGNYISLVGNAHCVVITGFESRGGSARIWVNDPSPSKMGTAWEVSFDHLIRNLPWNGFPIAYARV